MTTTRKALLEGSTYFSYLPPVRLLRVESSIYRPKFIVPLAVDHTEDLSAIAADLKGMLKNLRIGLDLDFHPPLLQSSDDIDTVRDFISQAAALNFYNQMSSKGDERAFDVSFVADPNASSKRALKYSKYVLAAKFLYPPAKRYYKVTGVECMRLIDLEEHHINEAGLTYAPHNMVKGKLNSRFTDSIESIYRDRKFKAKANGVVVVLTVEHVKLTPEMITEIQYELDHNDKAFHIGESIGHYVNKLLHAKAEGSVA